MNGKACRHIVTLALTLLGVGLGHAQPPGGEMLPPPRAVPKPTDAPLPPAPIPAMPVERIVPITLPAALQLAELANLDIAQAREVVNQALAVQLRGRAMTLPTLQTGSFYNDHDGQIQRAEGNVVRANRDSLWVNTGPIASFQFVEAVFTPLIARRLLEASRAGARRVNNDVLLQVADAYFTVMRARRRIARTEDTLEFLTSNQPSPLRAKSRGLLPLIQDFVEVGGRDALRSDLERVKVEVMRRQEEMAAAVTDFLVASAELSRLLHVDPEIVLYPIEDFRFPLPLPADQWTGEPLERLVSVALANRPEIAENQALVAAALARVRTAQWRPVLPNLAASYNIGGFGGGPSIIGPQLVPGSNPPRIVQVAGLGSSGHIDNFKTRSEFDAAIVWRLQNMGVGNYAEIREMQAAHRRVQFAQLWWVDRVVAQTVQAQAGVEGWWARFEISRNSLFGPNFELTGPVFQSLRLNFERVRGGEGRPLETLDSIRALSDLLDAYSGAATDFERARFRLMVALGMPPAEMMASPSGPAPAGAAPVPPRAAPPSPAPQGIAPLPAGADAQALAPLPRGAAPEAVAPATVPTPRATMPEALPAVGSPGSPAAPPGRP